MENKKFIVLHGKDEDGKFVRKVVPVELTEEPLLPECHQHGDYRKVKEDQIPETKEMLLGQLFEAIRDIAKSDKFWIVKRATDFENQKLRPADLSADDVIVGYKIDFPQMYGK